MLEFRSNYELLSTLNYWRHFDCKTSLTLNNLNTSFYNHFNYYYFFFLILMTSVSFDISLNTYILFTLKLFFIDN